MIQRRNVYDRDLEMYGRLSLGSMRVFRSSVLIKSVCGVEIWLVSICEHLRE